MAGTLGGNFLWVLDVNDCGGLDKVISVAQDTGYGICAKFHDGDPADDAKYGFQENFAKLAARCGPLSIPLVAWGYCYGDAYGNLEKEATAAVLSLKSGAQAYIIDAETEWEVPNSSLWAQRFMSMVLHSAPRAEIGMTTYWNLRWHTSFPAQAFRRNGCTVAIPQVYYDLAQRTTLADRQAMHAITMEDFKGAGYDLIYPAGEFGTNVTDTLDFLDIAGALPHSFWLMDGYQDNICMKVLRLFTKARKAGQAGQASQAEVQTLRDMLAEIRKAVKVLTGLNQA